MEKYSDVIDYLFARLPMFTRDGSSAIKKDINNTLRLCEAIGTPQHKFKSVHVAGTNGKGSSSHMLASILASAGYKTGLYTSPHLVDFRERIRINGEMIAEEKVIRFVNENRTRIEEVHPSFFEVTVAMGFEYFAQEEVDIAIIEVGLGGRLDSTNIITPELSLITNIGMDHTDILGNTMQLIAGEKAGIIKANVPVVVSERDPEVIGVFEAKAKALKAPLRVAADELRVRHVERVANGLQLTVADVRTGVEQNYQVGLSGFYQQKNVLGVLTAIDALREQGWVISDEAIRSGLALVQENTGLRGRWQQLSAEPHIVCDTGHNEAGIREVIANIASIPYKKLHVVIGAMHDKDLSHMLPQLPKDATYYFGSPDMPRAMAAAALQALADTHELHGEAYVSVTAALDAAIANYKTGDLIFVGGSNFVVAEVLGSWGSRG